MHCRKGQNMHTTDKTPLEIAIEKRLSDTGSTWLALKDAKGLDIQKGVVDGLVVLRKRKQTTYVTTKRIDDMERFCAKQIMLKTLRPIQKTVSIEVINELITSFEKSKSETFHFCDEQKEGIRLMVNSNLCILTGGPGTGKTSVIECVAYVLKATAERHIGIQFTAPTGKAAKRITESSGYSASTIQKYTGGFGGNSIIRRCHDYLFCDESSFIDLETLYIMMKSLFKNVSLFLIGDINQLPSVGIGAVLRDLIDCGYIPYVHLTQTFRQDDASVLYENIQLINDGCPLPLSDGPDFLRIRTEDNILENCVSSYLEGVKMYGYEETAILTPLKKKGIICANKLNDKLQELINPPSNNLPYLKTKVTRDGYSRNIVFKVGDPVISLDNTKDNVANGEVGKIVSVSEGKIKVVFAGEKHSYSGKKLNQLDLAYALTIYKAQGSEYKYVILPFLEENRNLDRNMINTGVSRAKKYCVVIGKDKVIQNACKKQSSWNRITFLREDLLIAKRSLEIKSSVI